MAEQDCSSDGKLEFEQSSKLSSVDPSESKTTTPTQAFDFSDQNVQLNALESTRLHCDHLKSPGLVDLDYYDPTEPPPLDWKSDSSSESGSVVELESSSTVGECEASGSFNLDLGEEAASGIQDCSAASDKNEEVLDQETRLKIPEICDFPKLIEPLEREKICAEEKEKKHRIQEREENRQHDIDHSDIQSLLNQLHFFHPPSPDESTNHSSPPHSHLTEIAGPSHQNLDVAGQSVWSEPETSSALLFSHEYQKDLLQLLEDPQLEEPNHTRFACSSLVAIEAHAELKTQADVWHRRSPDEPLLSRVDSEDQWTDAGAFTPDQSGLSNSDLEAETPAYKSVPGPCDPDDLLDGVIFGAKYLGSTQLQSEKNPSTNARMAQAQEAVHRIKAPEGESQPMTQVDLFISTQRIKVLSADTQEAMMDHALQMISYIADIEKIVVLMARRKLAARKASDTTASSTAPPKKCWMICHVFSSDDAQIIAQAIGQAFSVAYQQFLYANGIKSSDLKPGEYSDYLGAQELYNGDLVHFSCSENIREVCITKKAGDILGLAIVESGWGSILPTVVVANLLHGGPAERSGELSIGDRIMSVNGTSLVGLPITTCQSILRDLKSLSMIKLSIVHCPPVTLAIIRRPDPKYQLGFSVEDGIICSLMRGGIAERGGIRVGHRIIEINGQSVVATPHDKIIHILSNAVGEIHLKTMPTSTYRLLTGIDQPVYL